VTQMQMEASDGGMRRVDGTPAVPTDDRRLWFTVAVLCLGILMISIDVTVVTVALPVMNVDLHLSEASLAWVMNAYLVTYGGFLLLGGRLGDYFGHRYMFLLGISLFTLASLLCGLARSPEIFIAARAAQGMAGAVVAAVVLALIMNLFTNLPKRARALGIRSFIGAGGAIFGLLVGGLITNVFGWHFIFYMNVPVGVIVFALSRMLIPPDRKTASPKLDVGGAVAITAALVLAMYAIVNAGEMGWRSKETFTLLAGALILFFGFIVLEHRVTNPLMPPRLLRSAPLLVPSMAAALITASIFAWNVGATLYLQVILKYSPMQVGLAFLPAEVLTSIVSLALLSWLIVRFGIRWCFLIAAAACAVGLVLFARAPLNGTMTLDVLPAMLFLGFGMGLVFNPLLLRALGGTTSADSGLCSGIVSTSCSLGGALGLAIVVSIAAARTNNLTASGSELAYAINSGYHLAFYTAAGFACVAAGIGGVYLRGEKQTT
jgi:EmrB/QacA subfamily drug resistance transporter